MARPLREAGHMTPHPVRFEVEAPEARDRVHVLIRLALLAAIATVGCSSAYWLLYLALPPATALVIGQHGPARYLADDAPRAVRILRWVAAAYAYAWLLTDAYPTGAAEGAGAVVFEVDAGGSPTPGSALLRIVYSLPALLLLAILSMAAGFLWVFGAAAILVTRHLPPGVRDFLTLTLRFQFQLFAYHLSLVKRYPSLERSMTGGVAHREAV